MKQQVKRWMGLFLSWTMLLLTVQTAVFAAGAEPPNLCAGIVPVLSQNATKNAASGEIQAAALTDGVIANGYSNSAWFLRSDINVETVPTATFDLGAEKKVGKWVVTGASGFRAVFPKAYTISYSTTGERWEEAACVTGNTNYENTTEFHNITARYWRLTVQYTGENNTDLGGAKPYEQVRISEIAMFEGEEVAEFAVEILAPESLTELAEGETLPLAASVTGAADAVTAVAFSFGGAPIEAQKGEGGTWTAEARDLSAGDYELTATAYAGDVPSVSAPVRIRVHAHEAANIARGKPVSVPYTSTGSAAGIVDGNNSASTGSNVWFVNGTISATPSADAYAEIDLANGFAGLFSCSSISVYSGGSGDPAVTDFTLYYRTAGEWKEAVVVTGNTESVYQYQFSEAVKADAVKFVCNAAGVKIRLREIEVFGVKAKADAPTVTVTSPVGGSMHVSEDVAEINVAVQANGSTIRAVGAQLNGAAAQTEVTGGDGDYTLNISGLREGNNTVVITAENAEGTVGYSSPVTIIYEQNAGAYTIEITSPKNTTELMEGDTLFLEATVTGTGEEIMAVEFSSGGTVLAHGQKGAGGTWTAEARDLAAGSYSVIATAYLAEHVAAAVSGAVQVNVTKPIATNIARGKPVSVPYTSTGSAAGIVDGNNSASTGNNVWFVNGTMSSTPSEGAYAEIDLADGGGDIFSLSRILVYSGGSGDPAITDFSLHYRIAEEWKQAILVEGNTNAAYEYQFPEAVKADAVKLVCHAAGIKIRLRELEVYGMKAKADAPTVTVTSPAGGSMNVFADMAELKASVQANGSTIRAVGAQLNGAAAQVEVIGGNGDYTLNVRGLREGNNTVVITAENADGTVGYSNPVTVVFYDPETFLSAFAQVDTAEQLGRFISENLVVLDFAADDYTNLDKYGRIYRGVLSRKDSIRTVQEFIAVFEENRNLESVRLADSGKLVETLKTSFPQWDLSYLDTAFGDVLQSFVTLLAAAEFETAEELSGYVETFYALSKIKFTAWNGLSPVLAQFHACLELADYAAYASLTAAQKAAANQVIASYKTSERMNTKQGFQSVFAEAVAKAKTVTPPGPGGSGGGSGRGPGAASPGGTVEAPVSVTKPNTPELDYYTDVAPDHEAWYAITYLTKAGVVQGAGDGKFLPDASITREEFVKLLVEALFDVDPAAVTAFTDVPADSWYYPYVATAQKLGLVQGVSQDAFGSGAQVTREELAALIYRAAAAAGVTLETTNASSPAADEDDISTWAYYPVHILRKNGMLAGESVRPREPATRAEAAQLLYQIVLMEG